MASLSVCSTIPSPNLALKSAKLLRLEIYSLFVRLNLRPYLPLQKALKTFAANSMVIMFQRIMVPCINDAKIVGISKNNFPFPAIAA